MYGLSFVFVIGKPCGLGTVELSWPLFRLVLGPFALWIVARDLDELAGKLVKMKPKERP